MNSLLGVCDDYLLWIECEMDEGYEKIVDECRRYAPLPLVAEWLGEARDRGFVWPLTDDNDSCGDHIKKPTDDIPCT